MTTRSEQKKQQILKAAGALFCEQGYGVSMDAIAIKAEVSKQTVYAHFKTKDDLFDTCIRAKCIDNQLDGSLLEDSRTIDIVLKEFVVRFQSMLLSEEACQTYRAAVSQSDTHPQLAKVYLQAGPQATTEMLAEYLQAQHDKQVIKLSLPANDAAMQLLLMAHGKVLYWAYLGQRIEDSEQQNKIYLEASVDMFLKGHSQ
ncbi:TetR/AcrR family transcriptional regulator [Photobacterium sanguinicancri]|uniref:TetR/AcrR family transcriptional regulator n=1 Tax=Photobacterium sanguinicancri TaxID=875932 RepID=UPI000786E44C|nr:TetR/AcrR family transcriptional regulator [Photobacterium sanguinicancri]KXI22038.1 TetR family transcriptional regulator [Photobacterium sanguinicancri]